MLAHLTPLVSGIADLQGQPRFAPHLTLQGELSAEVDSSVAACKAAFQGRGAVAGEVTRIGTSDAFFMSFYLEIALPSWFLECRAELVAARCSGPIKPFDPHISLAYGPCPFGPAFDKYHNQAQDLVGQKFAFGRVSVVHSAKIIPIADWSRLSDVFL